MLELREAKLELLELVPRHEADLVEEARQSGARPLAQPDALVAPAADQLVDERARLLSPERAACGQLLGESVRPFGRQRDGADPGEDELLRELSERCQRARP